MNKRFKININNVKERFEADNLQEAIKIILNSIDIYEEGDYCTKCKKFVEQIDLNNNFFGCPICKNNDYIDLKWKKNEHKLIKDLLNEDSNEKLNQIKKLLKEYQEDEYMEMVEFIVYLERLVK
jgi:acetyl-CoA carboxylase beta subunit